MAQGETVTAELAAWASTRAGLPLDSVLEATFRHRLFDFAANLIGGFQTAAAQSALLYAARHTGVVPSPRGARLGAEGTALVWGIAAHALECDDTHQPSSTHPGCVTFASALPLAYELDLSLVDVARATIVGYEVMCAIGEAAGPADQYRRGFHPTGTCGAFGAAATSAVLLELGEDRIAAALGLAAAIASGSMAFLKGGWSKLLNVGHAASAGMTVAHLAGAGYRGPREAISPPNGFLAGHSDEARAIRLSDPHDSGRLAIVRTSTKAHGCCRYEQGPIDGLLMLRERHGFSHADVCAVRVGMLSGGWGLVADPIEAKRRPSSTVESHFSMPFGAALAIVHGHATPLDHNERNLTDSAIQSIMDIVECYRDPDLDARYPQEWPCRVEVDLRDGTRLQCEISHPKGDPENPLSIDDLVAKLGLLAPTLTDGDVDLLSSEILEKPLRALSTRTVVDRIAEMVRA